MEHPSLYYYVASVKEVIDGDSMRVLIDCGFSLHFDAKIRLHYVNAPEVSTAEGLKVKEWLTNRVAGKNILMQSLKMDKYGRWLALLWDISVTGPIIDNSINIEMLRNKLAKPYMIPKSLYKVLNIGG